MGEKGMFLSGPEINFELYSGSWAQFLLEKLKQLPKDAVIQVNGENGEEQTAEEFLRIGIQVAEGFKDLRLQPGVDIVPIIGNYSWSVIAAATGGMLSCVPIFPIDPAYKALELRQYFEACEPNVIFCEKRSCEYVVEALNLLKREAKIFLLDSESNTDPRFRKFTDILKPSSPTDYSPPKIKSPKDTPALVVTSSGTTGLPKAVVLTHTNVIYQLQFYEQYIPFVRSKQPYLQITPFFWISGVMATFYPCLTGLKVIFLVNVSATSILNGIEKYKPEWALLPPIRVAELLSHPNLNKNDLSSLRDIQIGGAMLPKSTIQRLKEYWPVRTVFGQGYGTTEVSGSVTMAATDNISSAGLVKSGAQIKVVEVSTGKTLGPNQIGELRINGGYSTMKGYLKNEGATREAFDESGFYRTGDLGYYKEDGHLFVIDRIKEMIKCRSHEISPSELENVILTLPGVKDVGVVGVPHDVDLYRPKALVVKVPGSELAEEDILKYVSDKLSEHKQLYGGVKFVDSIPRTPTGKIQRFLLEKMI